MPPSGSPVAMSVNAVCVVQSGSAPGAGKSLAGGGWRGSSIASPYSDAPIAIAQNPRIAVTFTTLMYTTDRSVRSWRQRARQHNAHECVCGRERERGKRIGRWRGLTCVKGIIKSVRKTSQAVWYTLHPRPEKVNWSVRVRGCVSEAREQAKCKQGRGRSAPTHARTHARTHACSPAACWQPW